ncbi:hypothetical protein LY78DRAFT_312442 [Colletotrichum sublineola]|nr:hypothetical protein LY78DRAFT_312442 [Colletotrichum sublineola]
MQSVLFLSSSRSLSLETQPLLTISSSSIYTYFCSIFLTMKYSIILSMLVAMGALADNKCYCKKNDKKDNHITSKDCPHGQQLKIDDERNYVCHFPRSEPQWDKRCKEHDSAAVGKC